MSQQDAINPQLRDLFATAIQTTRPQGDPAPQIVVNGSHNVLSWGGTVYLREDDGALSPHQEG